MKILAEASDENGWFLSLISVKYFSRFKSSSLLWYIKGFPASMLFTASSKLSRFSVQNDRIKASLMLKNQRVVVFNKRSVQRIVIFHRVFEAKVYVVKLI